MSSRWIGGGAGTGSGGVAGRSSGTLWLATGMIMMNMIRRTSITSTSGVVLIAEIGASLDGRDDEAVAHRAGWSGNGIRLLARQLMIQHN